MNDELGSEASDFELMAENGSVWRLSEHRGHVVALLFYPGNETLVCTRQLCSVRNNWAEYLETKAEIVAVSPSTPDENFRFADHRRLPISLLADPGREITSVYAKHWLLPVSLTRGVVVIDAEGRIRARNTMFRAFRPSDAWIIASIYEARGDELTGKYRGLKSRLRSLRV